MKGVIYLSADPGYIDEIKRKLRNLKKLEIKIRTGNAGYPENAAVKPVKMKLVWDEFFNVNGAGIRKGRYSVENIAAMSKENFKEIINEFFFNVYYKYNMENGMASYYMYDPEILKWMGLPPDSGFEDIKKKFRELAKKYHPDTGGDGDKFIKLMENYKKLVE